MGKISHGIQGFEASLFENIALKVLDLKATPKILKLKSKKNNLKKIFNNGSLEVKQLEKVGIDEMGILPTEYQ